MFFHLPAENHYSIFSVSTTDPDHRAVFDPARSLALPIDQIGSSFAGRWGAGNGLALAVVQGPPFD